MAFADFSSVAAHLDTLGMFSMDLGLDRTLRALAALGLTRRGRLACPVVQIVGTNGKGSTATFLSSLACAHGLKTGLYTSPHLTRLAERIRIDGRMLDEALWPALADDVHAAAPDLTYFEFLTVLAVLAFSRADVDCMILEAGLGGRHDATTAVDADLVCFTPMALDHTRVLGPTLAHIAADKAGAMRHGRPAVTAPQAPEAMAVLQAEARRAGCELIEARSDHEHALGLRGPHQFVNAGLALTAWRTLVRLTGWHGGDAAEAAGLASAFIPGRFQSVPAADGRPPLLLDGAHNAHGLAGLLQAVDELGIRPRAVVFTCLADKDETDMLPLVRRLAASCPLLVPELPGNHRARPAAELAAMLGEDVRACAGTGNALDEGARAPARNADDPVLVCGSLYLLGELFALYPDWLEPLDVSAPNDDC